MMSNRISEWDTHMIKISNDTLVSAIRDATGAERSWGRQKRDGRNSNQYHNLEVYD